MVSFVGIKETLARLIEGVQQVPHVYRPSTETFAELDIQKVARELDLEVLGQANGEKHRSQEDSRALDETEHQNDPRNDHRPPLGFLTSPFASFYFPYPLS